MRFTTYAAALLSASIGAQAGPSLKHAKYDVHARMAELEYQMAERDEGYTSQHLTDKTKRYAVDGGAIPEVVFNIGESYAGLMPIDSTDKKLYFWYVPTTNPAAKDEIVIWLNGGPGCSSLDGFLHENGPISWGAGTYRPVRNNYAWSNLSNVVWVEQPVGTGYTSGTPNATDEIDVADQFLGFWENFMKTFGLEGRKVYITGESYAGQYVPYIADAMVKRKNKKYFNLSGIMIYDPSIGNDVITEVVPIVPFVDFNQQDFPFNDSYREYIHQQSKSCGYDAYLERGLTFPPKGSLGPLPGVDSHGRLKPGCDIFDSVFNAIFDINPCFNIYQVGQLCPLLWDVLGFPYSSFYLPAGFSNPYFNRTDVKKALNAPLDVNWQICTHGPGSKDVFPHGDKSPPSGNNGGPLARVVEATNNVIVGHGAIDMVLILNGTLLTLQNLTWNGKQGFPEAPTKPFYVPYHNDPRLSSSAGAGVLGSWGSARGLTFVSVDFSGHMIPEFQPSAGYRTLELLLGRISSLSEVSAFSTQPGYPQSKQPLGMGNGPIRRNMMQGSMMGGSGAAAPGLRARSAEMMARRNGVL